MARCSHPVHFYRDERDLVQAVAPQLGWALAQEQTAVVVATAGHVRAIEAGLRRGGVDLGTARTSGSYLTFDAWKIARRCMVDGSPRRGRLRRDLWQIVQSPLDAGRPVLVVGEVAPLLWEAGDTSTALEIEELVNGLVHEHELTVVCLYPWQPEPDGTSLDAIGELCRRHTCLTSLPFEVGETVAFSRARERGGSHEHDRSVQCSHARRP
jgi:MEDS: MEthanogen/methylotroph, DcmR Sensory domain